MAKLGKASTPVDLLSYDAEDRQPSIFFLRQEPRQSILTVFNWTDRPRSHSLKLADYGLSGSRAFTAHDVLHGGSIVPVDHGAVVIRDQKPPFGTRAEDC